MYILPQHSYDQKRETLFVTQLQNLPKIRHNAVKTTEIMLNSKRFSLSLSLFVCVCVVISSANYARIDYRLERIGGGRCSCHMNYS